MHCGLGGQEVPWGKDKPCAGRHKMQATLFLPWRRPCEG